MTKIFSVSMGEMWMGDDTSCLSQTGASTRMPSRQALLSQRYIHIWRNARSETACYNTYWSYHNEDRCSVFSSLSPCQIASSSRHTSQVEPASFFLTKCAVLLYRHPEEYGLFLPSRHRVFQSPTPGHI